MVVACGLLIVVCWVLLVGCWLSIWYWLLAAEHSNILYCIVLYRSASHRIESNRTDLHHIVHLFVHSIVYRTSRHIASNRKACYGMLWYGMVWYHMAPYRMVEYCSFPISDSTP